MSINKWNLQSPQAAAPKEGKPVVLVMEGDGESAAWWIEELERAGCRVMHGVWETLFVESFPQDLDAVLVGLGPSGPGRAPGLLKRLNEKVPNAPLYLMVDRDDQSLFKDLPQGVIGGIFPRLAGRESMKINLRLLAEQAGVKRQARAAAPAAGLAVHPGALTHDLEWESVFGVSGAMQKLRHQVERLSKSGPVNVMISGEQGSGKETLARLLHDLSPRAGKPFVTAYCGNLGEADFDRAFLGSVSSAEGKTPGYFERANGGTLFLEEISLLSPSLQARLLSILEHATIRPIGGTEDIPIQVRLISSSTTPLSGAGPTGRIRQDLFYHLCVVDLHLPSLRERRDDILPLAEKYLAAFRYPHQGKVMLSPQAQSALLAYPFPGNLRELRNLMERAAMMVTGDQIEPEHLLFTGAGPKHAGDGAAFEGGRDLNLETSMKNLVEEAMRRADGNQTRAAEFLGIGHDALRYKLQKWGWLKKGSRKSF